MSNVRLVVGLLSLFVGVAQAVEVDVYQSPLRVDEVTYVDSMGAEQVKYQVDGIDIEMTVEDKVKAKNWNLSSYDWVKYKYAIEYTPRGLWTPDLDPPMVLGNLAKTEQERAKYARIANELEIDRRNREAAFQEAGYQHLKTLNPMMGMPKPKTGMARYLKDGKTILRSLFFDPTQCDENCQQFVRNVFSSTSTRIQLNMYYSSGTSFELNKLLRDIGVENDALVYKGVELIFDSDKYKEFIGDGQLPFVVIQSDDGVNVKYAH